MLLRIRDEVNGENVRSTFFVGDDENHTLQNIGTLTFRIGEWQLIGAALLLGAKQTHGHLTVEVPDGKRVIKELTEILMKKEK